MQNGQSNLKILIVVILAVVVGLLMVLKHNSTARQKEYEQKMAAYKAQEIAEIQEKAQAQANAEKAKAQADAAEQQVQADSNAKLLDLIKTSMKDPASVQFKDIKFGVEQDRPAVCGQMNAKNGFGGYSGYAGFYGTYDKDGKLVVVLSNADEASAIMYASLGKSLGCVQ